MGISRYNPSGCYDPMAYVVAEIGIDGFDECSYRAHQLMYWPTTPSNGEYLVYKEKIRMVTCKAIVLRIVIYCL